MARIEGRRRGLGLGRWMVWIAGWAAVAGAEERPLDRLVAALLEETPLVEDLRSLTDEIGGRPTGSPANEASVEWALERFRQAGVTARKEPFQMPARWLERSAGARILWPGGAFEARVAAMPFSTATPPEGLRASLLDASRGSPEDIERLGEASWGAFLLIETEELEDVAGIFREVAENTRIEARAFAAGALGVIYMGSRSRGILYRHNASRGPANLHPLAVMERGAAWRALRLLRAGIRLQLVLTLDLELGGAYTSHNVIGELRGRELPQEVVVLGAHLDSWGLGTGALDNGCNVALLIDLARQMVRLGLVPRRTLRFALWNGGEQGFRGSLAYVRAHREELDRHVMASSFDIGSGRIGGFFTGGRPEVARAVDLALRPVRGLGPFEQLDVPVVGTDNYDFMMEGVANLVANQASANYGIHYHARSDTFDKVDLRQLRLNAAIAAALAWGFAEMEVGWRRQSRAEIQRLIDSTSLGDDMRAFGLMESWLSGQRGRAIQMP